MKEVCIPLVDINKNDIAEVEVRIPKRRRVWKYRVESFHISEKSKEDSDIEKRIKNLRDRISEYDPDWELIQIFDSENASGYVQILYRYKK